MKNAETGRGEEEEGVAMIRRAVKDLHFGRWEEKEAAAAAIRDLAKRDASRKRGLAELGVVPSLVSMLVEAKDGSACRRLALEALSELADGSFRNKVLMIESGLLTKLPQLQSKANISTKQSLTPLLLSISSLAKTQFPFDSLPILSFLIPLLSSPTPPNNSAVLTLYNLSTQLNNSKSLIAAGAVHLLLNLCLFHTKPGAAEAALATLANLTLADEGRRALAEDSSVPQVLVDAMARDDEVKCQELVIYLLTVVAGRSVEKRRRMVHSGVVEMLMELALVGRSGLVRERAVAMLQSLKDGRKEEMGDAKGCKREIRFMVKESLHRNLESLMRRRRGGSSGGNRLPC